MSAPKRETVIADNMKYTRGADHCQVTPLNFSAQATVRRAQTIVSRCNDSLSQPLRLIKRMVSTISVHLEYVCIRDQRVVSDIQKYTTRIQNDQGTGDSGFTLVRPTRLPTTLNHGTAGAGQQKTSAMGRSRCSLADGVLNCIRSCLRTDGSFTTAQSIPYWNGLG
jgi:hypothetical protein